MLNRKFSAPQGSFDRGFLSGLATGVFVSSLLFFFIAALAIFMLPATAWSAQETADKNLTNETPRPIGDIRRDMEVIAKRSKNKDDQDEQVAGAIDLCILHHEIVTDPRFQTNDRLKSFRAITATRLKNVKKEVELALKRQARAEKKSKRIKHAQASNAQDQANNSGDGDEMSYATYHEILANEFESMSQFTGGPIRLWSYAGGPQCDYGEDLVDLITSTIDPDFWRTSGGEGVIEYYQPLRIIVVSGTAQAQDEITDLLRRFRYLSR